jgi:hypothetical protein
MLMHQWKQGHFSDDEIPEITRLHGSASSSAKQGLSRNLNVVKKLLTRDRESRWYSRRCEYEKVKYEEKKRVFFERAQKGGFAKARKYREQLANEKGKNTPASSVLQADKSEVSTTRDSDSLRSSPSLPSGAVAPRGGSHQAPARSASSTRLAAGKRPAPRPAKSKSEKKAKPGVLAPRARPSERDKGNVHGEGSRSASKKQGGKDRRSVSGSKGQNRQPAADQGKSENKAKKDARFDLFAAEIFEYWRLQNLGTIAGSCPWGVKDQAALSGLLQAAPGMTLEVFRVLLFNRAHSEVLSSDPPRNWLSVDLKRFAAGSLDRYKHLLKPMRTM